MTIHETQIGILGAFALLTGCAPDGAVSSAEQALIESPAFTAVAAATPEPACVRYTDDQVYISLDGTGSTGPAGQPLYYRWYDAGGALVATGVKPVAVPAHRDLRVLARGHRRRARVGAARRGANENATITME